MEVHSHLFVFSFTGDLDLVSDSVDDDVLFLGRPTDLARGMVKIVVSMEGKKREEKSSCPSPVLMLKQQVESLLAREKKHALCPGAKGK